jgi:hypothetical protein
VKTDQVCIACGLDLVDADRKLSARAAADAAPAKQPQPTVRNPAASGVATDVGQDTRLHVYDEFYAEELHKERTTAIASAAVGGGLGLVFSTMGLAFMGQAGGIGGVITGITPATMQQEGMACFADFGFLAALALGIGIAGILIAIGQVQRMYLAFAAIEDIKFGGRPTVVGIPTCTVVGMITASFLFPPLGLVLGPIFKLSDDSDTRDLGTKMLIAGAAAVVLFVANLLWGMAGQLRHVEPRERVVPPG